MPDQLLQWVELGSEPGVAPGSLERVRALLNTDDRFHGTDRLADGPAGLVAFRDDERVGGRERVETGRVTGGEVPAQRVAERDQSGGAVGQVVGAVEPVVGVEQRPHAFERSRGDPGLAPELDPPQQLVRHGHLP